MNELNIRTLAVFGGSGKLGQALIRHFLGQGLGIRAMVHHTPLDLPGVESVAGDVRNLADVRGVCDGADAVLCLATTKEDPDTFFDVSLKGTFNVLEACRDTPVKQLILAGGDAACGIWFYPHPEPIDETHPLMAYPGYYAFSKVMEEVMLNQYHIQYGLPTCVLRMSWIFERADILNHLSLRNLNPAEKGHGWDDYLTEELRAVIAAGGNRVPILVNDQGVPYTRHIVHLDDVVQAFDKALGHPAAIGETFHIAAPRAFRYDEAAAYLAPKVGLETATITASGYHSFEINVSKARRMLAYDPQYDIFGIIDKALQWRQEHP
ncbi:NAD(P)-dependent oxidoreductase [bacterium]|nr:NAD(P)-dependent oxidoreductase [bacterium]